ncbi:hypothetical protein B0I35DRAFT_484434 [Stachybotrys elegans]|uniref:Uncharacterized protein n=1 Tax=Stachybotrys elegans TaxID=80388 RepID=A0A8K0WJZ5_9HYPO|nr:hypothetical protein B0I35DRAFT_484434 [Stachybotrys elegans]
MPYEDDLKQAESALSSLPSRLRVPLVIRSILRARDDAEKLNIENKLALAPLSSTEKRYLKFFGSGLRHNCDLLNAGSDQAIEKTGINCEQGSEGLDERNRVAHCDIGPRCGTENCDIEVKNSDRIPSAQPLQNDDRTNTPLMRSASSRAGTPSVEDPKGGWVGLATSATIQSYTFVATSIEAMNPEATPSPTGLGGINKQMEDREEVCSLLINQDIADFINDSYDQIRPFSAARNSPRDGQAAHSGFLWWRPDTASETRAQSATH